MKALGHWNTGLLSSAVNLTSWGEGVSLTLVGHPSNDVVMIKIIVWQMFYYIDQPSTRSFPIGLVKNEFDFIVRSVETGLGRWMLVVAVISVDAYPSFALSDLTCHLDDTGIGAFWLHHAAW